jgi:hypothetical protein
VNSKCYYRDDSLNYLPTIDVRHIILVAKLHVLLDQLTAVASDLISIVCHRRPLEQRLLQPTVEHFDEAVSVAVVVNAATLTFTPSQRYQVVLAVASVDQIPGVPAWISFA